MTRKCDASRLGTNEASHNNDQGGHLKADSLAASRHPASSAYAPFKSTSIVGLGPVHKPRNGHESWVNDLVCIMVQLAPGTFLTLACQSRLFRCSPCHCRDANQAAMLDAS
jgi:hypothetical protein